MVGRDIRIIDYDADLHEALLIDNLREMDRRELWLICSLKPLPAIRMTVEQSVRVWAAFDGDDLICVFGINRRTRMSDVGIPWLVGTDLVSSISKVFLRKSKEYFALFERAFPEMENYVFAENAVVIRWLKWLGFDMDDPKPMGASQAPFIRFHRGMNDVL